MPFVYSDDELEARRRFQQFLQKFLIAHPSISKVNLSHMMGIMPNLLSKMLKDATSLTPKRIREFPLLAAEILEPGEKEELNWILTLLQKKSNESTGPFDGATKSLGAIVVHVRAHDPLTVRKLNETALHYMSLLVASMNTYLFTLPEDEAAQVLTCLRQTQVQLETATVMVAKLMRGEDAKQASDETNETTNES